LYVDPFIKESIANAIIKISNDEQLRRKLVTAGRERNKRFTWQKTAQDVIKVYRKLAGI
jgi:glycosyltransferase involved in cell wall biosynthesis